MKKIIIAAALVLTSAVTAYSLTKKEVKVSQVNINTNDAAFDAKPASAPKAALATAD
jgi:hypothetical protein